MTDDGQRPVTIAPGELKTCIKSDEVVLKLQCLYKEICVTMFFFLELHSKYTKTL